jgi:hypothetical protein
MHIKVITSRFYMRIKSEKLQPSGFSILMPDQLFTSTVHRETTPTPDHFYQGRSLILTLDQALEALWPASSFMSLSLSILVGSHKLY